MKKRAKPVFAIIAIFIIFIILGGVKFFSKTEVRGTAGSGGGTNAGSSNPVYGISDEEAIQKFDESFVYYLLKSIKAQNLHNPPFSSDTPKIEIRVSEEVYNAEISKGVIYVKRGEIEEEDIIIMTNKEEAVKMLRSFSYTGQSFSEGKSSIAMVSGKTELFAKGYLDLYSEVTGKSLT